MRLHRLVAAALLTLSASSLSAQQAPPPIGYKDPSTSTLLSVVVIGGGQIYSGDTNKGLTLMGIGYGSLFAGELLAYSQCAAGSTSCGAGGVFLLAGVAGAVGTWIYGIAGASDAAEEHNKQLGVPHATISPVILPGRREGTPQVGLGLKLSL